MSLSDSVGPDVGSVAKVVVIWSLSAEAIDADTTRFSNSIEVRSVLGYAEVLEKRGIPFAKAREAAQQAVSAHNAEETPLFAADIERKAAANRWA